MLLFVKPRVDYEVVFAYPAEVDSYEVCHSNMIDLLHKYSEELDQHDMGQIDLAYPIRFKYDRKSYRVANFFKVNCSYLPDSLPTLIKEVAALKYEPLRFIIRRRGKTSPNSIDK